MRKKPSAAYQDPRRIISAVFALAVALRLIFVIQWFGTPYGNAPFIDAQAYNDWAEQIAAGHVAHGAAFYLSPMLPYLLGLLYAIFGVHLWIPSLLNAVLGAATCALLARAAFRAFGAEAAIATGILAAVYKPFVFYSGPIMKEPLVLFFLALFVNFAWDALKKNNFRAFLWSGLSLGFCAIVRGNVLAFVPIILGVIYWRNRLARMKNLGGFMLGICVAILPITLHNAIVSHDFVPVSYSDGFNLYIGHNAAATGDTYVFPPEVFSSPQMEEYTTAQIASRALGHRAKPSEVSAYWRRLAVDYALTHPAHEFEMLLRKLRAFWTADEPYDNYDMVFITDHFSTILSAPLPGFALLAFLSVFAAVALRRSHKTEIAFFGGLVLLYLLSLLPFYVTERYRLPVAVFMLPLAGASVPAFLQFWRVRDLSKFATASVPAFVALALTFIPASADSDAHDDAYNWVRLTSAYEDQGYHVAALEAFDKAMAADPRRVWTDAWIRAADAKIHLGDRAAGEKLLLEAMKRYPSDGSVDYSYGRVKLDEGDYGAALASFQKAIGKTPTFTQSYRGLAVVYDHYGERAQAIAAVQRGLALVPNDPSLNEVMGELRVEP